MRLKLGRRRLVGLGESGNRLRWREVNGGTGKEGEMRMEAVNLLMGRVQMKRMGQVRRN